MGHAAHLADRPLRSSDPGQCYLATKMVRAGEKSHTFRVGIKISGDADDLPATFTKCTPQVAQDPRAADRPRTTGSQGSRAGKRPRCVHYGGRMRLSRHRWKRALYARCASMRVRREGLSAVYYQKSLALAVTWHSRALLAGLRLAERHATAGHQGRGERGSERE